MIWLQDHKGIDKKNIVMGLATASISSEWSLSV